MKIGTKTNKNLTMHGINALCMKKILTFPLIFNLVKFTIWYQGTLNKMTLNIQLYSKQSMYFSLNLALNRTKYKLFEITFWNSILWKILCHFNATEQNNIFFSEKGNIYATLFDQNSCYHYWTNIVN